MQPDTTQDHSQTAALQVTPRGFAQIAALSKKSEQDGKGAQVLKLIVEGGGCSGFQYQFSLVAPSARGADDIVIHDTETSAQVLVDKTSLPLLEGATLDYTQELIGSRFVVSNPNATASCGCGVSFSV